MNGIFYGEYVDRYGIICADVDFFDMLHSFSNFVGVFAGTFTGKSPKSSVLQGGDERRTLLKNLQECDTINP